MKSLIIVGAGEYGRLIKELAELCGYEKIGFLGDNSELAVGKVGEYKCFEQEYTDYIVAIGNSNIREDITNKLSSTYTLVSLVHPTAVISKSAQMEAGCVVEAQAVFHTEAKLGRGCFVNAGAVVNHNSIVESYCQIDCNAVVAARAIVPQKTKVASCTVWNS